MLTAMTDAARGSVPLVLDCRGFDTGDLGSKGLDWLSPCLYGWR